MFHPVSPAPYPLVPRISHCTRTHVPRIERNAVPHIGGVRMHRRLFSLCANRTLSPLYVTVAPKIEDLLSMDGTSVHYPSDFDSLGHRYTRKRIGNKTLPMALQTKARQTFRRTIAKLLLAPIIGQLGRLSTLIEPNVSHALPSQPSRRSA